MRRLRVLLGMSRLGLRVEGGFDRWGVLVDYLLIYPIALIQRRKE
jgi:hypothetical protein